MGTKAGDDGQIRRTQAVWDADTEVRLQGLRMYVTDGANAGKFKVADGVNTFSGMGDSKYVLRAGDAAGAGASQGYVDAADGGLQDQIDDLGSDDVSDESGWGTANVTEALDEISATFPVEAAPTVTLDTGSTNTAADPGSGIIRFNHGTIGSVTEIAVSDNINGVDKGDLLLGVGGVLQLRLVGTTTTIEFRIVSAVHTTWTRFTVVYLKGALPADATVLAMRFLPLPLGTSAGTVAEGNHTHSTVNGTAQNTGPHVITGTCDASGRITVNLSVASGSRPAMATATFIAGCGGPNQNLTGYVLDETIGAFVVEFWDHVGAAVASDGTPVRFTFIGTKA